MKAHNLLVTGSLTAGSGEVISSISSSVAATTLGLGNRVTTLEGKSATTGSNTFQGLQTINGNLVVTGSLTAQQFIVSSSVTYLTTSFASGSTKFGDTFDDTMQITGSVYITGAVVTMYASLTSTGSDARIYSFSNDAAGSYAGFTAQSTAANGGFHLLSPVSGAMSHVNTVSNYDTYLSTRNANNLILATANTERIRIGGSGGVAVTGSLNINGNTYVTGSVTAQGGNFTLSPGVAGGFKVTGVAATPPNMAYLANNYFPKFYTRPDQNYGITIFDQSLATAIQSGELVSGSTTQSLLLNPYGGNVGIGTTPSYLLDVGSASSTNTMRITVGAGNNLILEKPTGPSIQLNKTNSPAQGWSISPDPNFRITDTTRSVDVLTFASGSGVATFTSAGVSVPGVASLNSGIYLGQGAGNNAAIGSTRGANSTTFSVNLLSILPGMNFGSNNYALWITLMQSNTSIVYNALVAGGAGSVNTINSAGSNRITSVTITGTSSNPTINFTSSQTEYWSIIVLCCGT